MDIAEYGNFLYFFKFSIGREGESRNPLDNIIAETFMSILTQA